MKHINKKFISGKVSNLKEQYGKLHFSLLVNSTINVTDENRSILENTPYMNFNGTKTKAYTNKFVKCVAEVGSGIVTGKNLVLQGTLVFNGFLNRFGTFTKEEIIEVNKVVLIEDFVKGVQPTKENKRVDTGYVVNVQPNGEYTKFSITRRTNVKVNDKNRESLSKEEFVKYNGDNTIAYLSNFSECLIKSSEMNFQQGDLIAFKGNTSSNGYVNKQEKVIYTETIFVSELVNIERNQTTIMKNGVMVEQSEPQYEPQPEYSEEPYVEESQQPCQIVYEEIPIN